LTRTKIISTLESLLESINASILKGKGIKEAKIIPKIEICNAVKKLFYLQL
jgi:hypothetical protein